MNREQVHGHLRQVVGVLREQWGRVINDRTMQKDETAKVRVGDTNVILRCLQIGTNSVLVHVLGPETNLQLFLRHGPERSQK